MAAATSSEIGCRIRSQPTPSAVAATTRIEPVRTMRSKPARTSSCAGMATACGTSPTA